jgi:hypothetical protein
MWRQTVNDRLEDLLYQSGLTAQGCWDELDDYAKQGIEKFAELIVKECADFLKDTFDDHFAAEQLVEHFEVEE